MIQNRYSRQIHKASAMIQHLGRAVRGARAFFIYRDRSDPTQPQIVACHPPLSDDALLRAFESQNVVCSSVSEDDSHQAWVGIATDESLENTELAREMTAVVAQSMATELRSLALEGSPGASRDRDTGLPDRDAFDTRVAQAIARLVGNPQNAVVVMVVDLDRFFRVAARFGEAGGTEVIRIVGERLQDVAERNLCTVARIGNDRFGLLLIDEAASVTALQTAQAIHDCLKAPLNVGDEEIFVSASIGVAVGTEDMRACDLIQHADLAIIDLLEHGGAGTLVFRAGMQSLPALQLLRERDVRRAVDRNEFTVHFQPIVGAKRGGLHAFEALLRWRNPEEGLLPPSMFLDILRETGLIETVGRMVIRESCRHAARWLALSGSLVPVSVNIVAAQLYADGFCADVARTLEEEGLPPQGLMFELTEDALVHDAATAQTILYQLRRLGVGVMIDDFGTGYSSLSYLHDLPVSGIKLDQMFFRSIDSSEKQREIVRTIVRLAHFMGMLVVAEGIESHNQWAAVRELDCDLAQGFCFARPFDAEHATRFLAKELARGKVA